MAALNVDQHPFEYRHLSDPSTQVRFINLQRAGSHYDIVEFRFEHVDIGIETTGYIVHEPLDHEDVELDHAVVCDGTLLYVSEHTYFFLWTMRNQEDARMHRVWSSRVCVDGKNQDETTHEPTLRPLIYNKALQRISMAPSYKYSPLPTKESIRLIELDSPGFQNGLLKARMRHVLLSDTPEFYYLDVREGLTVDSWPEKGALICNNRLLSVPKPLSDILSMLLSKGPRAFWIEAICVDKKSILDCRHHKDITDERLRKACKERIGIIQPEYSYTPLPDHKPHIRLLKLLPASADDDVLVADIGHFPLNSCPPFVALSYVWGPTTPQWMVCTRDGRYIICTQSLRIALRHLRQRGQLIVWADAICINQNDNVEKSKQVMLMGDIYRRASRVVVELGVCCDDENHRTCRVYPPILTNILSLTGRVLKAIRPERPSLGPREYAKFGIPPSQHQAWSGWRAMRSRPWFTRSWIVQEVAAGRDITVLYNGKAYKWEDLDMANRVTANEQVDLEAYIGKMNMTNIGDLQGGRPEDAPRLVDLVSTFRSLDATDPRDKIYAFRGLASDEAISPIPDYTRSIEDVYMAYARFFIQQGDGIKVLQEAGLSRSGRALPSWCPDWGFSTSWQTYNYGKHSTWLSLKSLQGRSDERESQIRADESDSNKIKVMGCLVADVSELSSAVSNTYQYGDRSKREAIEEEIRNLYKDAKNMVEKTGQKAETFFTLQATIYGSSPDATALAAIYERSKILGTKTPRPEDERAVDSFDTTIRGQLSRRRFCLTKDGHMGVVPECTEVGDAIAWLKGARGPAILRRRERSYVLVGDAFVNGLQERGLEMDEMVLM